MTAEIIHFQRKPDLSRNGRPLAPATTESCRNSRARLRRRETWRLAALLPHQKDSDPIPEPVVAILKDIQSAQQHHVALLQQDSTVLASLRATIVDEQVDMKKISAQITDEHDDVKKISVQISKLTAKVDALQSVMSRELTSSIPTSQARKRLTRVLPKKMARQYKPVGPVSIGGTPVSVPATILAPQG